MPIDTAEPVITVRGLSKTFGRHRVLDDLEFHVFRGEVFTLLGPNGAGKTTTINVLTTLVRPDRGHASGGGRAGARDPDPIKRRLAPTRHAREQDDALTGAENLVMLGRLSGLSRRASRARASELLERFGLTDAAARRVGTYSGGMRRRLDLALSFVVAPEVLFLDEPTTGLDTRSRRELWDVIRSLAAAGTTVFLTTQYLEEADQLADRIAVLDGGRIVAIGTAAELKSRVGADTVELHDADGALLREIPTDGTVPGLRRALDALDESGATGIVTLRRPSLDDVFLALTTPDGRGRPAADRPHTLEEIA